MNIATPTRDNITCFYSRNSPLSNHFPCDFVIDEVTYNSSEQYFTSQKAWYAKNKKIYHEIMQSRDPVKQKTLAKRIQLDDNWKKSAPEIMLKGLRAKFGQNPDLQQFLKQTGTTLLAEASLYDKYWGIGLDLQSPNIWQKQAWKGLNTLGELLMQVRAEL